MKDSSNMKVVFLFGESKQGEWSSAPPKSGTDVENNMICSAEMGVGKVAGIKIDQATGELRTAFVLPVGRAILPAVSSGLSGPL
jgi:hypothetical protein